MIPSPNKEKKFRCSFCGDWLTKEEIYAQEHITYCCKDCYKTEGFKPAYTGEDE